MRAQEQVFEQKAPEIVGDSQGYESRSKVRPARRRGTNVYRFVSVVITALIAAAIGFGIAVFTMPIEKATQFHTYVNRALDGLHDKYRVRAADASHYSTRSGTFVIPGGISLRGAREKKKVMLQAEIASACEFRAALVGRLD